MFDIAEMNKREFILNMPIHNYGHYCKSMKKNGLCISVKNIAGEWHEYYTDHIYYNWYNRCFFSHPKPHDQVLRPHIICKTNWIDESAKEAWEKVD